MASDNTVTLVGNVTDDPELRFTPTGQAVVSFTVAVNRRFQKDGQWEDRLDGFFRCSAWRDMAENIAETLQRGTRVVVVGRLQQRSWEDSEGNKRSAIVSTVGRIGRRRAERRRAERRRGCLGRPAWRRRRLGALCAGEYPRARGWWFLDGTRQGAQAARRVGEATQEGQEEVLPVLCGQDRLHRLQGYRALAEVRERSREDSGAPRHG
jgi:single-strand DNA-binding protein